MPMPASARRRAVQPPRWKLALLTWLGIYPLATVVLAVAEPHVHDRPLALRTLALTGLLAPGMVFIVMPLLQRAFRGWLYLQDS